jgi:alpha 1,3-glucosidase
MKIVNPFTVRRVLFLIAVLLVGGAVFIKEYFFWIKFKSCDLTSFCRRYRHWKALDERPSISIVSASSLKYGLDDITAHVSFSLKSSAESAPHYGLTMDFYRNQGTVRLRLDDVSEDRPRERYRIPEGDVVVEPASVPRSSLKPVRMDTGNGVSTIVTDGLYRVEIVHNGFVVRVFNGVGDLIQVVNSRNYFTFEKYRKSSSEYCPSNTTVDMACHPEIDSRESWAERFTDFMDEKPFGPSSVGMDIEFINSSSVFGIPMHTTGFNLPLNDKRKPRPWYIPHDTFTDDEYRMFNCDVYAHEVNVKSQLYGTVPLLTSVHSHGDSNFFLSQRTFIH